MSLPAGWADSRDTTDLSADSIAALAAVGSWSEVAAAIRSARVNADAASHDAGLALVDLLTKLPMTATPNAVPRTLNTTFQVSASYPALVFYTVELEISFSLLSSQAAGVNLLCDANNPPTNIIAKRISFATQTLGLAVTTNIIQREPLIAYVPAGHYVKLQSNGAGTATLLEQTELVFANA